MINLSFVVPVYNVEQYLAKCLDSILVGNAFTGQVICVNDGSTDGSAAILDHYVKKYQNVEVITRTNSGLSAARNAGLKAAKGEYVCFLDSDDYWQSDVLGGLLAQIERDNLDVLRFNYQNVNDQYEVIHPNKNPKRDVDYSESVVDGETFLNERLGPSCYSVMFIFRRELIYPSTLNNRHSTLFTPGIYFEDVDWTPRMLLRAKRVASTSTIVYNYLWRAGSITLPTNIEKQKKVIEDKIRLLQGFKEQSLFVRNPKWYKWMTSFTTMSILGILAKLEKKSCMLYIKELQSMSVFPLSTIRTNWNERMKIRLANISPRLFLLLMRLKNR